MKASKIPYILCACMALALMSCDDSGTSLNGAEAGDSSSSVNLSSSIALASSSSATVAVSSSSLAVSSSSSIATPSSSSTALAWCATTGNCGTFTDIRDSKVYRWTKIGSQTWMAENLAYLPSVNTQSDNSSTEAKYYVYEYDGTSVSDAKASGNYTTYGVLYNWTAAMAGGTSSTASPSGVQGACPSGWHLPSSEEWATLENYVGGSSIAGMYLKATSGWTSYSGISNLDAYGFSALPGGFYYGSDFSCVGSHWWTATVLSSTGAFYRLMGYDIANVYELSHDKYYGSSVRCVQN